VTCIFCAIAAGDVPAKVVYADDAAVAFLDVAPLTTGHTLVIPRRHVDDLLGAAGAWAEIGPAVEATAALLVDRLGADGLNVYQASREAAGQTVFHLHVHLLPRRRDDGLISLHSLGAQQVENLETTHRRLLG
jgi:histidine triad (HIT) family protein